MGKRKKIIRIIMILVIVGLLVTGGYFLFRQKTVEKQTVKLTEEVTSITQAYDIANGYVQNVCPRAKLYMYGVQLNGKEEIQNESPGAYIFAFDGVNNGSIQAYMVIAYTKNGYMDIYKENNSNGYYYYKPFEMGITEMDMNVIIESALKMDDMGTINELMDKYPDLAIAIMPTPTMYYEEQSEKSWMVKIKSPDIDKTIENVKIEED